MHDLVVDDTYNFDLHALLPKKRDDPSCSHYCDELRLLGCHDCHRPRQTG